jgi:ElaB/YqjD/DUF883 family membrane-anchored ribosome-binding protein
MGTPVKGNNGSSGEASLSINKVAAMAHQAVDKAAEAAAPTAEWLTEQGDSLKATQTRLVADTCSYVSANPMKSVGIAIVAGVLLGRILL